MSVGTANYKYYTATDFMNATTTLFSTPSSSINQALSIFNSHGYALVGFHNANGSTTVDYFELEPAPTQVSQFVFLSSSELRSATAFFFGGSYSDDNDAIQQWYNHGYFWFMDNSNPGRFQFTNFENVQPKADLNGYWQLEAVGGTPAVSPANTARILFSNATKTVQASFSGSAYKTLLTALNFYLNDVIKGAEQGIDFVDTSNVAWDIEIDPLNNRAKVSATAAGSSLLAGDPTKSCRVSFVGPQTVQAIYEGGPNNFDSHIAFQSVDWDTGSFANLATQDFTDIPGGGDAGFITALQVENRGTYEVILNMSVTIPTGVLQFADGNPNGTQGGGGVFAPYFPAYVNQGYVMQNVFLPWQYNIPHYGSDNQEITINLCHSFLLRAGVADPSGNPNNVAAFVLGVNTELLNIWVPDGYPFTYTINSCDLTIRELSQF